MLIFNDYKIFLNIFFLIGLAPNVTKCEKTKIGKFKTKKAIQLFLPKLVPLIGMLISLGQFSLLLKIVDGTLDGQIHVILFYGYFLLVVLSNIFGNIQCIVYRSEYKDIIRRINQIERLFLVKFSNRIDFQRSYTIFKRKTFIIFSILMIATLTSYTIQGWHLNKATLLRSVVTILEIMSSFVCLHPILYLDIIRMFIFEMSDIFKKSKQYFQISAVILGKDLKKLKSIHFEVCNMVKQINIYFGLNLIFLLIKFFVDVTYNLYWIFIEFQELGWSSFTHIGIKWKFTFIIKKFN